MYNEFIAYLEGFKPVSKRVLLIKSDVDSVSLQLENSNVMNPNPPNEIFDELLSNYRKYASLLPSKQKVVFSYEHIVSSMTQDIFKQFVSIWCRVNNKKEFYRTNTGKNSRQIENLSEKILGLYFKNHTEGILTRYKLGSNPQLDKQLSKQFEDMVNGNKQNRSRSNRSRY